MTSSIHVRVFGGLTVYKDLNVTMPASRKVTSSIHVRVFGSLTVYKDLNVTMPYKALNGHEDTNRYKMSDLLLKFVGQGYKEQLNTSYLEWRDE